MNKWEKVKRLRSLEVLGEAPQEASQNLQSPETAPYDKRITGRTKPLSLKATPEFHKELKRMAAEKECLMIEILEKALECYKKNLTSGKSSSLTNKPQRKEVKNSFSQPLEPYFSKRFICDSCQKEFYRTITYSPPNVPRKLAETYCVDCVEEEN